MEAREGKIEPGVMIELNEAQKRARRMRNLAIGGCLLGLVAVFYVATIVKIGPNMMKAQQTKGQSQ
ncbi:MAG: hypothetical protein ACR2O8_03705 [Rhizobiaceae bacterium]